MKHWPTSENNKSLHVSLKGWQRKLWLVHKKVKEFIFCDSTSGVVERSFGCFPALSAVALVKWQTLLPRAGHHLQVARRIFGLTQVPYTVHPATGGVRHVENLSDRVHGQVVLMSRAGASETNGVNWRATSCKKHSELVGGWLGCKENVLIQMLH